MAYDSEGFERTRVDPKTLPVSERLAYLRDFLRDLPPEKFNMHRYECGTAACIAGWAGRLFVANYDRGHGDPCWVSGSALGISYHQAVDLFLPRGGSAPGFRCYDATPKRASKVVGHLIETGEVDWSRAFSRVDGE
jgi:hypothetical protein